MFVGRMSIRGGPLVLQASGATSSKSSACTELLRVPISCVHAAKALTLSLGAHVTLTGGAFGTAAPIPTATAGAAAGTVPVSVTVIAPIVDTIRNTGRIRPKSGKLAWNSVR